MISLKTCFNKHAQPMACRLSVCRNTHRVTLVQTLHTRTAEGVIIMGARRSISNVLIALYTHRADTALQCYRSEQTQTFHTYVRLNWLLRETVINEALLPTPLGRAL